MGLDLYLLVETDRDEGHARWSYGGFNRFRERLAEAAGLGELGEYVGYGGDRPWPSVDDEPLVALLNHSDCEGEIWGWEAEGLGARLREVIEPWEEDDYDRLVGLRLASMFERAARGLGVVVFR